MPGTFQLLCTAAFSVIVYRSGNSEVGHPEKMTVPRQSFLVPALVCAMVASAAGQVLPSTTMEPPPQFFASPSVSLTPESFKNPDSSLPGDGVQQLLEFKDSDIKFSLQNLMDTLRDHKHEGWVLAAYPDPATNRPLIGAGFSLDVPAREHPQNDPFNPHPFVEPSSAQLWQAAGLAPDRLQQILDQYNRDLNAWSKRTYRRKVIRHTLAPQLTEDEATQLLRISAIQAIDNARAYCRNFDQLTAPQQMALSQLVFQMGVNLEAFVEFLGAVNDDNGARELPRLDGYLETDDEHWRTVQRTLIESQWARQYPGRAATVIAMFDSQYTQDPSAAQVRVEAVLRPPVQHRRNRQPTATLRRANYRRAGKTHGKTVASSRGKRKLA
jgi:hypothetical protein